jgi:hypothetical protein
MLPVILYNCELIGVSYFPSIGQTKLHGFAVDSLEICCIDGQPASLQQISSQQIRVMWFELISALFHALSSFRT